MMVQTRDGLTVVLLAITCWTSHIYAQASTHRGPPKILGRDFKPLQVVRTGQEFRVACPIEGDPSPNVDWFKDGEPITSAWSGFRVNSKALRIRSVLTKDSGIYECKGVNGFGSIIARTRLVVADDSLEHGEFDGDDSASMERGHSSGPLFTPESLEQSGSLHISSGNSIRFKCDTKGVPIAKVMWYKDGKAVSDKVSKWTSWTLVLSKLTSEDSGSYTCRASNAFGKNEFNIQLEITEMMERRKPTFVSGYPNNATVLSGGEAILECAVRGGTTALPPHIKWLKRIPYHEVINGNSVKNKHLIPVENQHVLVIQDSEEDGVRVNETQINGTYISRLLFKQAVSGVHEGVYVCLATNSVGYTFKDAHLTILAGAEIVQNSSSGIPFPLIVFLLSTALSLLVTGSACCLRNYQKTQQKQSQTLSSARKLSSQSVSVGSSSASSSYQKSCSRAAADHRQLLVVPTMRAGVHSGLGSVMCHGHDLTEPVIEIALSRCSYCGDDGSSEISGMRTYEHCYNGSYLSSTSHSMHCGHWT
ncbi:fibroblast growth factor receptor-like 1 isoform X2 [Folsomia candida]|uniref:receptor protein-tyrosine kinase n=2 Tax=Folsomia candida TaxID=158441 RepID=A0A226DFW8_FOLCA|nr:fibroblast growth factor receptor-like 1 isoform X2 [Folsomia candida]XP_035714310.1 fibroblast growth factor receptor-like 1 isoform X2 [Folsomia candida]XP_035714311.1 fibroblast growth factor receptor-like 1 isoform X2 [Folsomia candida]OXA44103.1 Fibroblast growth factor receptor-like 1 [Folsomia candida]